MAEIEGAWARKRLLVVGLIAQHELTVEQIMKAADVSRQTVFTSNRDKVVAEGMEGLLKRKHSGGRRRVVPGKLQKEFAERLSEGPSAQRESG